MVAFDVFSPVKGAIKSSFEDMTTSIADQICDWVASLTGAVLRYVDKGLGVDFTLTWFKDNYEKMMVGGFLMALAVLLVQAMVAAVRRNPQMLLMSLSATLVGIFASFVALSLVMMVSGAIDDWSGAIVGIGDLATAKEKEIRELPRPVDEGGVGPFGAIVMALLNMLFAFLLFLVAVIRRIGIYVIALFIPVYCAGLGGSWTSPMVKRAGELLFVLLMSKLAIVATFQLGHAMLAADPKVDGSDLPTIIVTVLSGVVVMGLAAFSPLGLMYLTSFGDALLVGQLAAVSGHTRGAFSAVRGRTRALTGGLLGGRRGGGGVGGGSRGGGGGRLLAARGGAGRAGGALSSAGHSVGGVVRRARTRGAQLGRRHGAAGSTP